MHSEKKMYFRHIEQKMLVLDFYSSIYKTLGENHA